MNHENLNKHFAYIESVNTKSSRIELNNDKIVILLVLSIEKNMYLGVFKSFQKLFSRISVSKTEIFRHKTYKQRLPLQQKKIRWQCTLGRAPNRLYHICITYYDGPPKVRVFLANNLSLIVGQRLKIGVSAGLPITSHTVPKTI